VCVCARKRFFIVGECVVRWLQVQKDAGCSGVRLLSLHHYKQDNSAGVEKVTGATEYACLFSAAAAGE